MKICAAQTNPTIGDIQANIVHHISMIEIAASYGGDLVVFPELSITGYEPKLAKKLATHQNDSRFDVFQKLSDTHHITIGVGMPISSEPGVLIGMIIFQPKQLRQIYCKQHLHADELPYFVNGQHEILLGVGSHRIAPAICYESLLPEHAKAAAKNGASFYLASVAKSVRGVEKAVSHFPKVAREHSMTVLMSNCIGPCDDFVGVGKTSVWNRQGDLLGQLDDSSEGLLIFNSDSHEVLTKRIP